VQVKNLSVAVICLESHKFKVQEKTAKGMLDSPRLTTSLTNTRFVAPDDLESPRYLGGAIEVGLTPPDDPSHLESDSGLDLPSDNDE
jgi:hypothetical protein